MSDIEVLLNRVIKLELEVCLLKQEVKPLKSSSSFWMIFNQINSEQGVDQPFNHSNIPDEEIAVNLHEVIQFCYDEGIELPPKNKIISELKSERYYMGNFIVRSRHDEEPVRCYVFKRCITGQQK